MNICKYSSIRNDLFFCIFIGYISINYYFHSALSTYLLFYLTEAASVYFLIRFTQTVKPVLQEIIPLILLIWGINEATYGWLQLYNFCESNNSLYKITGTFQNPGPYSGYLAILIPIATYNILNPPVRNMLLNAASKYISWIYVFLAVTILPAGMSRASWLATIAGTTIVMAFHYKLSRRFKIYYYRHRKAVLFSALILTLFLLIAGTGLYQMKKDSADGRLLMWKITTHIISEHPLTGVGTGNFAGAYGQAQAQYFAAGDATYQEKYVAGSPEYGFNEFLQITTENGFIGFLLFLGVIILAFRNTIKNKQIGLAGSLTTFLIFACFSYPFSVIQLNILFIVLLALTNIPPLQYKKQQCFFIGLMLLILLIPLIHYGKEWKHRQKAMEQWGEEQTYYNMDIYDETVNNYRKLYRPLCDEPQFLYELGQCLSKTRFYEESNLILKEGAKFSADPMFWNIMGKNYQAMCRYSEAEKCFLHAYNMIPHRLYPLYLLAQLYFHSDQAEKGIMTAKRLIAQKPKIMSPAVEEMKAEMKEHLRNWDTGIPL